MSNVLMGPGMTAALRALVLEVEAQERELMQLRRDVERIAMQNSDLCDEVHSVREENKRLRAALSGADTVPASEATS